MYYDENLAPKEAAKRIADGLTSSLHRCFHQMVSAVIDDQLPSCATDHGVDTLAEIVKLDGELPCNNPIELKGQTGQVIRDLVRRNL